MIDHRYFSEMSRALHIFRDFSFLICAVLTFIRIAVGTQMTKVRAKTQRIQPLPRNQRTP
jgi:hypothetical protein